MLVKLFIATLTLTANGAATTSIAVTDYPDRTSCELHARELTGTDRPDGQVTIKTKATCREVVVRDPPEPIPPAPLPEFIPDPRFFQPRPGCWRPGEPGCYRK